MAECPECKQEYEPHPAYRHKAPVCDPHGYCGGAWDQREEDKTNLVAWLRSLRCEHPIDQLADFIEKEWPTGPFRSTSVVCAANAKGQCHECDGKATPGGIGHRLGYRCSACDPNVDTEEPAP